ncbi:hypothetical protein ALC62_07375, partial [Cyphomyrmex costatus]
PCSFPRFLLVALPLASIAQFADTSLSIGWVGGPTSETIRGRLTSFDAKEAAGCEPSAGRPLSLSLSLSTLGLQFGPSAALFLPLLLRPRLYFFFFFSTAFHVGFSIPIQRGASEPNYYDSSPPDSVGPFDLPPFSMIPRYLGRLCCPGRLEGEPSCSKRGVRRYTCVCVCVCACV